MPQPNNSLLIRLPNWVGDVMMALPTLDALTQAGFECHVFGKSWVADLLSAMNYVVHTIPKGIRAGARAYRELDEDRLLLLPNSLSSALSGWLANKMMLGYRQDGRGVLLDHPIKRRPALHEVDVFWRLGRAAHDVWGGQGEWPTSLPSRATLLLSSTHRDAAQSALTEAHVDSPYWVLCPMAHGLARGRSKRWPYWAECARFLQEQGRVIVACPGPGEEKDCAKQLPGAVILSDLSLGAYAAILAGAEQVVANDSGPMHMAAAVGAPVLGIFGVTQPYRTRPWGGDYIGSAKAWPSCDAVIQHLLVCR